MLIYLLLQERETIKSINHAMKILNLKQNANARIQDVFVTPWHVGGFYGEMEQGDIIFPYPSW